MSDANLLGHVNLLAKLFVEFVCTKIMDVPLLRRLCAMRIYAEFYILEGHWASQSSGARSIPTARLSAKAKNDEN